jgi:hypothetical protein
VKAVLIIYLTLVGMVSMMETYTPYKGFSPKEPGLLDTTIKDVQEEAQKYETLDPLDIGGLILAYVKAFLNITIRGVLFQFEIANAPVFVNELIRFFFGILSVIFWIDIVRSVLGLVWKVM